MIDKMILLSIASGGALVAEFESAKAAIQGPFRVQYKCKSRAGDRVRFLEAGKHYGCTPTPCILPINPNLLGFRIQENVSPFRLVYPLPQALEFCIETP